MKSCIFIFPKQNQRKEKNIVQYVLEVLKYRGDSHSHKAIESWPIPAFPVSGNDLMAAGVPKDKKFGNVLKAIKEVWMESDYKMNKQELLAKLPDVVKAS